MTKTLREEPAEQAEPRSAETPVEAEAESFGTWLRRQRELREIDLREIAETSKISMTYLQAFEQNRFDVLPATVFAKGFLRQYARYVGLDPEEVVNFYMAARRGKNGEEDQLRELADSPEPRRKPAPSYGWLAVLLILLLGLVVYLLSRWNEERLRGGAPEPQSTATAPAPGADAAADAPAPAETAKTETASTETELTENGAPAAAPPDATAGESAAEPAAEPSPPATATTTAFPPEAVPAGPAGAAPLQVTLDFSAKCWVEAQVDGRRTLSELKVQGESVTFAAQELIELKLGDVNAVQVEVNGRPYPLRRDGQAVQTLRIDLATVGGPSAGAPAPAPPSRGGPANG